MSSPLVLQITSVDGRRIQLRTHMLAFLTRFEDDPERFEASLPGAVPLAEAQLKVQTTAELFSWEFVPKEPGRQGGAENVLLIGRCGAFEVASGSVSLRGSALWDDWRECDQIDLVPVDAEGCVCGDSQSIAHPAPIRGHVAFHSFATQEEVEIRPEGPSAGPLRVTLWRRVQNGVWTRDQQEYAIPQRGLCLPVPHHQGAFVVTTRNADLVDLRFFAFGALHAGDETDYRDLQGKHSARVRNVLPDWPLWFQTQVVHRLKVPLDAATTDERLMEALRTRGRLTLFAGLLDPARTPWQPGQSVEEFVRERWPYFATVLDAGVADGIRAAAWSFRESPLLPETLEWTGPSVQQLELCLGWTVRRRTAMRLGKIVPPEWRTALAIRNFAVALTDMATLGQPAETVALQRWGELIEAVKIEFDCAPEALDALRVQEARLRASLHHAAVLWDGLLATAPDVGACLQTMIEVLTEARNSSLAGLVDACVQAGVLEARMVEGYPPVCARIVAELERALADPPVVWMPACASLATLLSDPLVVKLIACQLQARQIEARIVAGCNPNDPGLAALQQSDASLQDFMNFALASARERAELERRKVMRQAKEEVVRSVLPKDIPVDSEEAERWIAKELEALKTQASSLTAIFGSDLSMSEHRVMDQEIEALVAPLSADPDRLAWICAAAGRIARWRSYQKGIAVKLLDRLQAPGTKDREAVSRLLGLGRFEAARRLPWMIERLAGLNEIAKLAHLDVNPAFADEIRGLQRAAERLNGGSVDDVDEVFHAYDGVIHAIEARGGEAAVYQALERESKERLYALSNELRREGMKDVSLDDLDRVLGAVRSSPVAESLDLTHMLPQEVPFAVLQAKFRAHGLVDTGRRLEA